ncbi:MAG: helix-turn-helix domain-containing protein, partial [Proteobacteria bacterium]|nr:helix-turn-helix domain-containing protein [Pseudomonadota bacterium]
MQEYIEIARRLGGLREAMGLEIADLAAQTGVEAEKVGAYESGMVEIPVGYLLKVAQVCEVDMTALLSGADAHLTSHSLVRNGKGLSVERRTDYDYRDLAYRFKGKKMQPFEI